MINTEVKLSQKKLHTPFQCISRLQTFPRGLNRVRLPYYEGVLLEPSRLSELGLTAESITGQIVLSGTDSGGIDNAGTRRLF